MKAGKNARLRRMLVLGLVCLLVVFSALLFAACSEDEETTTTAAPETTTTAAPETTTTAAGETTTTAAGETTTTAVSGEIPAPFDGSKDISVTMVREFVVGAWGEKWIEAATGQATALGIDNVKVLDAGGDMAKMVTLMETAINEKPDAIIIGHGKTEAMKPLVDKALAAGIKIVTDNLVMPVEGVPEVEQDDMLIAYQILRKLVEDTNGKADLAYIWVAGFAPMEKRDRIYNDFMWRFPQLVELARYGTASASTMNETLTQTEALLREFPEGELGVIYATWNEFAKGATEAVMQAGRDEIKIYGIDITDVDIEMMTRPGSPWVATSGANSAVSGSAAMRAAAALIAGETVPKYLMVPPTLITQQFLLDNNVKNLDDLGEVLPFFNDNPDLVWYPWMKTLVEQNQ